ncbi:Glycosyltransferase involved in cell wall bisynthesis [Desulfatibacillum alkenivorans DSM 16219]|uniref:Glycosyltransferase involved in cell wall bisynthesis n=1 Tax=Desulfatibacillum alkenivorans DSM 16219 TaxID=1121393 RepID=A0A1M6VFH4_9BACT|nr:glycosyltransferase family 4 protein [Desulfatibacillum alkenivorans]SHK80287.1 Glycosyltransferase involved in cell wall bisynthesis [Desulfatibacillum alkenivorans DSM 16219]
MASGSLTIVQMLPELEAGGVERGTLETGAYLVGQGHRSIVISGGGRLVPQLVEAGTEHVEMRVGDKNPSLLKYLAPVRSLLLKENVDVLHLRSRVPAWVGYLAAKSIPKAKRPVIITTFHGFYSVHFFSGIMARGERVIAISNFIADHIKENYGTDPSKIRVIHRGFDPDYFNPEAVSRDRVDALKKSWGLDKSHAPVIMLPARITGWKGHKLFIEALSLVRDQDFVAVCVGDVEDNPEYSKTLFDEVKERGLEGRVLFPGHCSDMPAALMNADMAVSASLEPEAFGRVAVEAQAMGLPVVATAHGGSLETVLPGETGWLVSHESPAQMAQALKEALADPDLRRKMGARAKSWVWENFTATKMCSRTLEVYHELLKEKGRGL